MPKGPPHWHAFWVSHQSWLLYSSPVDTHDERVARLFLSPTYDQLHEPYAMLGMKEAVARLKNAIDNGERVLIYGDYDVDGTTGTAVLLRALKLLGANGRISHSTSLHRRLWHSAGSARESRRRWLHTRSQY